MFGKEINALKAFCWFFAQKNEPDLVRFFLSLVESLFLLGYPGILGGKCPDARDR